MRSPIRSWTLAGRRSVAGTLILVTLSGSACQAWHTEQLAPAALLADRHPEELRVTKTDSSEVILEQPELRGDTLLGTTRRHDQEQEVGIPLSDVGQVATRRFSAGRTFALVVGVAAVAVGTIIAVFLINCPGTSACSN